MSRIIYCQGTYNERVWQTKDAIKRLAPFVDKVYVMVDQTVSAKQKTDLQSVSHNVETVDFIWKDNFPEMRNEYLKNAKEGDWVIVSDPDEWFNEEFCKNIREITGALEGEGVQLALINSHDIWHEPGKPDSTSISSYFKNLVFKYRPGVKYEGCGTSKNVHEILEFPTPPKTIRLAKVLWYEHHKYMNEVWERAMRNMFIGGGGDNIGEGNKAWQPLRQICEKVGIKDWNSLREYMRRGQVHPDLVRWLVDNRYDGTNYEHEMSEGFRWYFEFLHPEENANGYKVEPKVVSCKRTAIERQINLLYREVLEREADPGGTSAYATEIESGSMTLDDLKKALYESSEYMERIGRVPIDFLEKWNLCLGKVAKDDNLQTSKTELESCLETFKKECPPDKFPSVLDAGAGDGMFEVLAKDCGYFLFAITIGNASVEACKKNGQKVVQMDVHDLKFTNRSIDAIVVINSFHEFVAPFIAIKELARVLRIGGRLLLAQGMTDVKMHLNGLTFDFMIYMFTQSGMFTQVERKDNLVVFERKEFE